MSLPKIVLKTEKIKLPISNKTVEIRPFTVKEQKVMLMTFDDTNDMSVIEADSYLLEKFSSIMQSCVVGNLKLEELTPTDFMYLCLKIRSSSVGESQELNYNCPCGTKVKFNFDLNKIKCEGLKKSYEKNIKVTPEITITLGPLTLKDLFNIKDQSEEDLVIKTVAKTIKKISDRETVYMTKDVEDQEVEEFVENLPIQTIQEIEKYQDNMPYLVFREEIECPDEKRILEVRNFRDFFM